MESKTFNLNKVLYMGIGIILAFLLLFFAVLGLMQSKDVVYFYDVAPNVQKTVIKIISETENVKAKKIKFESLDSTVPLSSLVKTKKLHKASLIIVKNNLDSLDLVNNPENFYEKFKTVNFSTDILEGMPQALIDHTKAMSKISKENNASIKYIPFLYDFYQVDVFYPTFLKSNVAHINTWDNLVTAASNAKDFCAAPILINFANNSEFINTLGSITEALSSPAEYESLLQNIYAAYKKGSNALETEIKNQLESDSALKKAVDSIKVMHQNKSISNTTKVFSDDDVQFYKDNGLSLFSFTTLGQHRNISREVINNYKTIYYPGETTTTNRKFCSPEFGVICPKEKKYTKNIILNLVKNQQVVLCSETGLVPVQKNCSVPDIQSDDARYWLAASNGPVLPLEAALPSVNAKELFANIVRDFLK